MNCSQIIQHSFSVLDLEEEEQGIDHVESPLESIVELDPNNEQSSEHSTLLKTQRVKFSENPADTQEKHTVSILVGVFLFFVVYVMPIFPMNPCAHSAFAIVVMVCYYWISESIPPFVASYLIPILSVFLRIGVDPKTGQRIPASDMATIFAAKFMDPVILVFLGSLTLSAGLSKLEITTRLSKAVLSHVPTTRPTILLVLMLINIITASVLSNVASTTLTLSLALPIMKTIDSSDPFNKALLFGIAWSGNCGGMATLIASPQNVIASSVIEKEGKAVTFMQWLSFGIPVSIILLLSFWGYLCARFIREENSIPIILDSSQSKAPWTIKHTLSSIVTVVTILMWALSGQIGWFMGHTGIAALIPVVWFFGSGILTIDDFNTFKWSTLVLLGGGMALGETMKLSGLLDLIGIMVRPYLSNVSIPVLLISLLLAEGIIASLLSSTTAASILFPLILAVSEGSGHGPMLVCLSALMISGAQLFHISSFPNALVSGVCEQNVGKDEVAKNYLTGQDFILVGWPTILMGVLIISTVGYMISSAIGL